MSRASRTSASASSAEGASICDMMGLSGEGGDSVMWVVRAVLVIYAAFVASNLPANVAGLFDNTVARLVVVVLILSLAVCDPASAILLTIGFVLSIQAANKQHISKLANVASTSAQPETFIARAIDHLPADADNAVHATSSTATHVADGVAHVATGAVNMAGNVATGVANTVVPHTPHGHGHGHSQGHPQAHSQAHHAQHLFTDPNQFHKAQSNTVQNNQHTEVRTWKQEMGPQGLAEPAGYVFKDSGCSPALVQ